MFNVILKYFGLYSCYGFLPLLKQKIDGMPSKKTKKNTKIVTKFWTSFISVFPAKKCLGTFAETKSWWQCTKFHGLISHFVKEFLIEWLNEAIDLNVINLVIDFDSAARLSTPKQVLQSTFLLNETGFSIQIVLSGKWTSTFFVTNVKTISSLFW